MQETLIKNMKEVKKEEWNPKFPLGYDSKEVRSALQKAIRRSNEKEAIYWAAIILKAGWYTYLAEQLKFIIHEDIGIANPTALTLANQLWLNWSGKKKDPKHEKLDHWDYKAGWNFMEYVNVIICACRGKKTRMADNATNLVFDMIEKSDRLEIPDYAIDVHTDRGKQKYGSWDTKNKEQVRMWFDEWAKVEGVEPNDPYEKELKERWNY